MLYCTTANQRKIISYNEFNITQISIVKFSVQKCCRADQALYILPLDGGQQGMALIVLQKRLTGSSLAI